MAWARAFYALAQGLSPGDRILTGMVEYGANYVAMLQVTCILGIKMVQVQGYMVAGFLPLESGSLPIDLYTLTRSSFGAFSLKPTQADP